MTRVGNILCTLTSQLIEPLKVYKSNKPDTFKETLLNIMLALVAYLED